MTLHQVFNLEDKFSATLGGASDASTCKVRKKVGVTPVYAFPVKRKTGKSRLSKIKRKR